MMSTTLGLTDQALRSKVGASTPTLVYFRLFGLVFGMPLARFVSIVLGPLWVLHAYVERELAECDAAGPAPRERGA